jgi:MFS family permease
MPTAAYASAASETPTSAKGALLVVFLTVVIDLLGFGIVVPLLPIYAKGLEADDLTIGLFMASFSAMQFLFAPIWGRISDRIGRRPVLLVGLAGSAAFYALFGWATSALSLPLLFLARIGAGIAGANIAVAQAVIADVTPPERRAKGMALVGAAFGIGFTFGPLLGAPFVSSAPTGLLEKTLLHGHGEAAGAGGLKSLTPEELAQLRELLTPAAGYLAAGLSAGAFLLGLFLLPETLKPETATQLAPGVAPPRRGWLDLAALRAAAANPSVGVLILSFFLATFAFGHFEGVFARITTDDFGWSLRGNFLGFAVIGLILAFAQGVLVRKLAAPLGEVTMTRIGAAAMTVGLAGLGAGVWFNSMAALMGVLPVLVTGFAFLTPSIQSLISRRSPSDVQGAILGLNQSASALARILGPFLGNVVYNLAPRHSAPFALGAALMGLAFLLSLSIAPPTAAEAAENKGEGLAGGH